MSEAKRNRPSSKTVLPESRNVVVLYIGDYAVMPYQHGGFWVENEIGEGMQVKEETLERALREFWHEHF